MLSLIYRKCINLLCKNPSALLHWLSLSYIISDCYFVCSLNQSQAIFPFNQRRQKRLKSTNVRVSYLSKCKTRGWLDGLCGFPVNCSAKRVLPGQFNLSIKQLIKISLIRTATNHNKFLLTKKFVLCAKAITFPMSH